jgi:hypothetical protein
MVHYKMDLVKMTTNTKSTKYFSSRRDSVNMKIVKRDAETELDNVVIRKRSLHTPKADVIIEEESDISNSPTLN